MASAESDYITRVRALNRQIWDGINGLVAEQRQFQALDYGNTLPDGEGANEGITKAEIGSVVFDTADAMVALLDTGHATNMSKLL